MVRTVQDDPMQELCTVCNEVLMIQSPTLFEIDDLLAESVPAVELPRIFGINSVWCGSR